MFSPVCIEQPLPNYYLAEYFANIYPEARSTIPGEVSAEEDAVIPSAHSVKRGTPDSPTGGYAQGNVECPSSRPVIRAASALSNNDSARLLLRRNKTIGPMTLFLTRVNISGFDAPEYISRIADSASALPY